LAAPPIEVGLVKFGHEPEDHFGNVSFSMGAAFLAPFANRIRGRFLESEQRIETKVLGQSVVLPANGGGKRAGAEHYAIHGLMLNTPVDYVTTSHAGNALKAHLDAGDFDGRWLSSTDLEFTAVLEANALSVRVTATNVGAELLPIGLGWHPYFSLPSGLRQQARLWIPATNRLLVDDYVQVLPTGGIVPVAGTPYDFTQVNGVALGDLYLDDCFVSIEKSPARETVCDVIDPAAAYGLRITSTSPEVRAIQTFAPPEKAFVVIEPQFNWADPFGPEWGEGIDTGTVVLQPRQSVAYQARLELFTPC
jgi:aldose 1-epimerase